MDVGTDLSNGSEWELSKENVQPLKSGRKIANLSAALGRSSGEKDYQAKIHNEKQAFEAELRTYEGSDPLHVWYRYIVWMCENFPTGGRDQTMLLERCISLFKDEEKYKNDERYLKIWMQYADLCADPSDVYDYMHSQSVCNGLAKFYESWAYNLERLGNYKMADEVYTLGINRNAEPVDMLKRQHRAFESRFAERLNSSDREMPFSQENEPQRTTLGGLKSHGKKATVGVKRTGNALSSKKGGIGGAKSLGNSKSTGFAIFQDDGPGSSSSIPNAAGEWQVPPTQPIKTKENTQKPGKWSETKLSQKCQSFVPFDDTGSKQSFTVHVDDDIINNPPCTPRPGHIIMDKVLSSRKPDKHPTNDLLRSMTKAENAEDPKVNVMYCKDKIYAGAAEFSFEELRAARMFAKLAGKSWSSLYPDKEEDPYKNCRVMYPKAEVYPLDGKEQQLEEVLAKRHFAKLQARKEAAKAVGEITAQVNTSVNMVQTFKLERDEPMEFASCQNSVKEEPGIYQAMAGRPGQETVNGAVDRSARRGLLFRDTSSQESPKGDSVIPFHDPPSAEPCTASHPSAFTPVIKGTMRPALGDRLVPAKDDDNSNSSGYNSSSDHSGSSAHSHMTTDGPISTHLSSMQGFPQPPIASNAAPDGMHIHGNQGLFQGVELSLAGGSTPRLGMQGMGIFGSSRTPDANRSGDTSHLTAPSPTVTMNTKAAMDEVMAMFSHPLMSEANEPVPWGSTNAFNKLPAGDDFEAAFSNENGNVAGCSIFNKGPAQVFAIYDETKPEAAVTENPKEEVEDQENRPPVDYFQEASRRPLAGVLQPSLGIPVCPMAEEDEDMGEDENQPPIDYPQFYGATRENYITDTTRDGRHEPTDVTTYSSFSAAARVASTPFHNGIDPPSFSVSGIQPSKEQAQEGEVHDRYSPEQFACTPSKMLSPIFERSDEDYRSSSSSSSTSSGRGSVSHHMAAGAAGHLTSIAEEQRSIMEEPSMSRHDMSVSRHDRSSGKRTMSVSQFNEDGTTDLNPFSDEVVKVLLSSLPSPVSTYEGYCDLSSEELPKIASNLAVGLGDNDLYRVEDVVGTGAFAKVYRACKLSSDLTDFGFEDNEDLVTLKVQRCSSDFEFYICRQLHARMDQLGCPQHMHRSFMSPSALYSYSTGSVIVDQYHGLGTLLDVTNKYKVKGTILSEAMAVIYVISLLRMLHTMHRCDIIHGDIKPDNILIVENDESYDLRLIDFGRSIDMRLFPQGTAFTVDCYTDAFQCVEMKTNRPWTTQVDTYGLLGVLHCLIHGEYMNVYLHSGTNRWQPTKTVKRHWNVALWNKLFDSLLNVANTREQPSLSDLMNEFQQYYDENKNYFERNRKQHVIFISS